MKRMTGLTAVAVALTGVLTAQSTEAAIALDRTRAIFNGDEQSMSLSISNQNKELPYLAQSWVEDAHGTKITGPLTALPPLQRVEPGAKGQVKLQAMNGTNLLPQDRESLFYFNLREIPPKSSKPNTLQIALQTRIKLFYRPKAIIADRAARSNPWEEKLTLTRQGNRFRANNPTPYYITLAAGYDHVGGQPVNGFNPVMVPPMGSVMLTGNAVALGVHPVLTYINDYGGRPKLIFSCGGSECRVTSHMDG